MAAKSQELIEQLMMHAQSCPQCNMVLMENDRQRACETGFELSIRWLEHASKKGSRDAWHVLQELKANGTYRPS